MKTLMHRNDNTLFVMKVNTSTLLGACVDVYMDRSRCSGHAGLFWCLCFNFLQDVVGGDAFGFGFEIGDEAVAEGRKDRFLNVVEADVESSFRQGTYFGCKNQCLGSTRAAAEPEVLIGDVGRRFGLRVRGED